MAEGNAVIAALLACRLLAVDGDTLRCGAERIRLLAIDAPELPGHCRRGRRCVTGDARAATIALAAASRGPARITRVGYDRYGRTLARVEVAGRDLSCHQLRIRAAVYVARWDTGGVVAQRCAAIVRTARTR